MRSALAHLAAAVVLTVSATACDRTRIVSQADAGPICNDGERLVNGECRFVCDRDSDCPAGERCDLLLGKCVMRPPPVDSGTPPIPCTEGAVRCAVDGMALEACDANGAWVVQQQCAAPDGYCQDEICLACRPGAQRCAASGTVAQLCAQDGSGWRDVTCAMGATCVSGECHECELGQRRCSPDGVSVQECKQLPREDLSLGYVNSGDNFDGTCITRVCEQGTSGPQCRAPACVPGATQCLNNSTQQTCSAQGAYTNVTCSSLPGMGATAECLNGACVDECGDAARDKSYFGCEYWSAVMDNVTTASVFKGNTTTGQGSADSEFAFVVSNRSTAPTVVTVQRWVGSAAVTVKTVSVPGRTDPATRGLAVIKVPWQSLANDTDYIGVTGQQRYAYRITTTHPVTVYQFNPLSAVGQVGTCNNVNQCNLQPSGLGQTCTAGKCNYFAYSNDASLLLPAHILGTSYVGLTPEHIAGRTGSNTGTPSIAFNGTLSIVGTANGTQVTVKATARTRAGGSITAMNPGETRVFTLNAYDVLQLSTDNPTNVVSGSTAGNLECGVDPYDNSISCILGTCDRLCRVASDLTGTVITATAPIAVFGGSACTLRGYLDTACDHVEEQLFPFVTWGQNFVAARTAPLRLTDNTFASATNAGPDYYKIVAGCPDSQCPNGTTVSLSTTAVTVLTGSNGCEPGTSLGSAATPCRLRGGKFVEFQSKTSFKVSADKPIQVAQLFAGQNATLGTTRPAQGDPSLVLLPPVEQWRNSYTVLTAPGTRDNYIGIVVDDARVLSVQVDGAVVTSGWSAQLPGTTFKVVNVPVATGTHTIQVVARPGQTSLPGAGVTVYGFDSYVSYGYTGGLDLTTIVTGINPGG